MNYSWKEFIRKLYQRTYFGKVQKKITLLELKSEEYRSLENPVFIVSTGRCRTHWLTNIIADQKDVFVNHSPDIPFLKEGKLYYDYFEQQTEYEPFYTQLFFTARDKILLECAKRNLQYVETNNRITFALPVIKDKIYNSRFVHITRNPFDFIISGINRNWFEGDGHDLGRITMHDTFEWNKLNTIQKIGWLWFESNNFILKNTLDLKSDRYFFSKSEDLNTAVLRKIFIFAGIKELKISSKWTSTKTNFQTKSKSLDKLEILKALQDTSFNKEFFDLCDQFGYNLKD